MPCYKKMKGSIFVSYENARGLESGEEALRKTDKKILFFSKDVVFKIL